jgi:hypothetical protein
MPVATASYVKNVLPNKADEKAVLGRSLAEMTAELPALTAEVGESFSPRETEEIDNTGAWGGAVSEGGPVAERVATTGEIPTVVRKTTRRPPPRRKAPGK